MSEREAFLRAIAADPSDDTVRLALADWLDEHDDPDRAEFIRLQIKRERSGRRLKNPGLPPREQALLNEHEKQWLGPLAELTKHEGFEYTFRRGFVESAAVYGRLIGEHAGALRAHCPALTELDVIGVRGFGELLADGLPSGIRTLRLEDWPFPDDAKALAKSSQLKHLESLSFWIGSENDEAVCRAIGASRAFPALKRVELVQLNGGIDAFDQAAEFDARAHRLADVVNTKWGNKLATVYRPCSELFPLAPHVGRQMHGGHLPDGHQVLLHVLGNTTRCSCWVFRFNIEGDLLSGEIIELVGCLHKEPEYGGYDENELFGVMKERIGFTPGMIRVHEFDADQVMQEGYTRLYRFAGTPREFIDGADSGHDWFEGRESQIDFVRLFLRGGSFCMHHGCDDMWLGQDGTIHST